MAHDVVLILPTFCVEMFWPRLIDGQGKSNMCKAGDRGALIRTVIRLFGHLAAHSESRGDADKSQKGSPCGNDHTEHDFLVRRRQIPCRRCVAQMSKRGRNDCPFLLHFSYLSATQRRVSSISSYEVMTFSASLRHHLSSFVLSSKEPEAALASVRLVVSKCRIVVLPQRRPSKARRSTL